MEQITGKELIEQLSKLTPEQLERPLILSVIDESGEVVNRFLQDLDTDSSWDIDLSGDLETYTEDEEIHRNALILNGQGG